MADQSPRIEEYAWGRMEWLADHSSDPGVGVSLARMVMNPGATSPKHRHDNCSEILHVVAGSVQIILDDGDTKTLSTGETHVFSAYVPHSLKNMGDGEAVLMLAFSSGNRHYKPLD